MNLSNPRPKASDFPTDKEQLLLSNSNNEKFAKMSSSERDEIIFGFTEQEVKFLLMSLKCIETHGNRRFVSLSRPVHYNWRKLTVTHHQLNCARLAQMTGYSPAYTYEYYMDNLLHKVLALPPIDLTGGSDDQENANTSKGATASQTPSSAAEEQSKADPGTGRDEKMGLEKEKEKKKDVYKGIGDGVDGTGGNPEDEKELQALGSAYAWDC